MWKTHLLPVTLHNYDDGVRTSYILFLIKDEFGTSLGQDATHIRTLVTQSADKVEAFVRSNPAGDAEKDAVRGFDGDIHRESVAFRSAGCDRCTEAALRLRRREIAISSTLNAIFHMG